MHGLHLQASAYLATDEAYVERVIRSKTRGPLVLRLNEVDQRSARFMYGLRLRTRDYLAIDDSNTQLGTHSKRAGRWPCG